MSSRSALGWLLRTARNSGSRTGLPDWLLVAIRARRALIRRPAGPPVDWGLAASTGAGSVPAAAATGASGADWDGPSGALVGTLVARSSATPAPHELMTSP